MLAVLADTIHKWVLSPHHATPFERAGAYALLLIFFDIFLAISPTKHLILKLFKSREPANSPAAKRLVGQFAARAVGSIFLSMMFPRALRLLGDSALAADPVHATSHDSYTLIILATGYFLYDIFICVTRFDENGHAFILHAVVCTFAFSTALVTGQLHHIGAGFLMWESSTPFLYSRWFVMKRGWAKTWAMPVANYAFVAAFFACRVVYGPLLSKEFFQATQRELKAPPAEGAMSPTTIYTYYVAMVVMNSLNYFWFFQMVRIALFGSKKKDKRGKPKRPRKTKGLPLPVQKPQHITVRFYQPTMLPSTIDTSPVPPQLIYTGPSRRVPATARSRRLPTALLSCWVSSSVDKNDENEVYSPSPVRFAERPPPAFPRPQLVDSTPLGNGALLFNNHAFSIAGSFGEGSPVDDFEIAAGRGDDGDVDGGSPSRSLPMRTRLEMMGDVSALCAGLPASRATSPVKAPAAAARLPPLPPGARRRNGQPPRALKSVSFVISIKNPPPSSSPEAITPPLAGKTTAGAAAAAAVAAHEEEEVLSTPVGLKSMRFVGVYEVNEEGGDASPSTGASSGSTRSSPALERLKSHRAIAQRRNVAWGSGSHMQLSEKAAATLELSCAVASPPRGRALAARAAEAPAAAAASKVAVQWGTGSSQMLLSPDAARALRMGPRATTAAAATAAAPVTKPRAPAQPIIPSPVMSKGSATARGVVMVPLTTQAGASLPPAPPTAPRRPASIFLDAATHTGPSVDATTQTDAALEVSSISLKASGGPTAANAPQVPPAAADTAGKRTSSPGSGSSSGASSSSRRSTSSRTSTFSVTACLAAQAAAAAAPVAAAAVPAKPAPPPATRVISVDDDTDIFIDKVEKQCAEFILSFLTCIEITDVERALIPAHYWGDWRHLKDIYNLITDHREGLGVPLKDYERPKEDSEWLAFVITP